MGEAFLDKDCLVALAVGRLAELATDRFTPPSRRRDLVHEAVGDRQEQAGKICDLHLAAPFMPDNVVTKRMRSAMEVETGD